MLATTYEVVEMSPDQSTSNSSSGNLEGHVSSVFDF